MKRLLLTPRIEFIDNAWKYFVNESYIQALLPYPLLLECPLSFHHCETFAQEYDGLIITGGYDIAAHYFHQPCHEQTHLYDRPLDYYDFLFLDAFVKQRKPILGICRGMQLINVYFHGTLCQHFDISKHEESEHAHHAVPLENTIFSMLLKKNTLINSYHHQCVDILGNGLQTGVVATDQRVEAVYHNELPILGVQWHPEKLDNDQVIPYFISQLVDADTTSLFPNEIKAKPK